MKSSKHDELSFRTTEFEYEMEVNLKLESYGYGSSSAIPRLKHRLSMASTSTCPHKKLKSKILAHSDFALMNCAQSC